MADVTLASRPAASALVGDENIYIEQGGTTKRVTPAQIAAYVRTSGIWTPVVTAGTNCGAVSGGVCRYVRHGDMVQITGRVNLTPLAAGSCNATFTLPVATVFASSADGDGPMTAKVAGLSEFQAGRILATAAGSTLQAAFNAVTVAEHSCHFSLLYRILP